jgi:hypothetical protein
MAAIISTIFKRKKFKTGGFWAERAPQAKSSDACQRCVDPSLADRLLYEDLEILGLGKLRDQPFQFRENPSQPFHASTHSP